MFYLQITQAGGDPEIFWFSFIFSISSSALDNLATAPPSSLHLEEKTKIMKKFWS